MFIEILSGALVALSAAAQPGGAGPNLPPPTVVPGPGHVDTIQAPRDGSWGTQLPGPGPSDPLAGWSEGTAFLRSPDNSFVLLPNGRLQVDGYVFRRPTPNMPNDSILLRRARLELGGWIGSMFYFNIAGDFALGPPAGTDPVAQSWLNATDNYVLVAPWADLAMLQVGQFDAPFTLENRTSDKYFDFMERSLTVRTFGIPSNKEVGAMVHGLGPDKLFYYSLALINGDGQNFRNADNRFDLIGRAWIAPLAYGGIDLLERLRLGGSFWLGSRAEQTALPFAGQTTQAGFSFFASKWSNAGTNYELHQSGNLNAYALEVDFPITHELGLRFEYVQKDQTLGEVDGAKATSGAIVQVGTAKFSGHSFYVEAWYWLLGDDRIIGEPGLQIPHRVKKWGVKPPEHGLMLAARYEKLDETLGSDRPDLKDASLGTTQVASYEIGLNYWYSKRYRFTLNCALNNLKGDTPAVAAAIAKNGGDSTESEFMFRFGIAL